jgi:hypothetical protein
MPCSVQCHINNIVIFQHHPFDRKSDGCSKGQKVKLFWSMSKGKEAEKICNILSLSTSWRWDVNFMHQQLYTQESNLVPTEWEVMWVQS